MINLREVDIHNFNDIIGLRRDSNVYVGGPEYVLAEAYVYRHNCTAYAIYDDNKAVGLVILCDKPEAGHPYSFTGIFIADDCQRRGYGQAAVESIMEKFRKEGLRDTVEIQVHSQNEPAIKIYTRCGFKEIKRALWNNDFIVMRANIATPLRHD